MEYIVGAPPDRRFSVCLVRMTGTVKLAKKIESASIVCVIDGDPSFRHALSALISSVGLHVQTFGSAQGFLRWQKPDAPSCLILAIRLPDINGLDFQNQLADAKIHIPIIFVTAYGDVSQSVRAMKSGAVDFLTKPIRDQDVLDAIHLGLERDRVRRVREMELNDLRQRFESLTIREREVVAGVVSGLPNKQIGGELGVTENTVKVHRSRAMEKMQAQSLPELVKMIERLDAHSGLEKTG